MKDPHSILSGRRTLHYAGLLGLLLAFWMLPLLLWAQEFQVQAPRQVVSGQQFTVSFTINADGQQFTGPDFKGFSVLSGPNPSTRSNIQVDARGQMVRSFTKSYTYYLLAGDEGTYTIGSARIAVDGEELSTEPIEVKVVTGAAGNPRQQAQPQRQSSRQAAGDPGRIAEDDVFIKAFVDKTDAFVGEQILITYRIYTRRQISLPNTLEQPSFNGFWTEDLLKDEKQYRQTEETYNGQQYVVVDYKKLALFPQKAGSIRIDPFEIEVAARVQSQRRSGDPFFDNFFGGSFFNTYQNVQLKLKSNPVNISVKALPASGQPSGFKGAVGQYAFSAAAEPQELKTNEAATIRYTIEGKGNLKLLQSPEINFPPDLEVFDPKISDRISLQRSGVSGSRTYEYLTIPRAPGTHQVPEVSFHFFDPERKQYRSLSVAPITFTVERGEGENVATASGFSQEDIRLLGSDIHYIKTEISHLSTIRPPLFFTPAFWLWLSLPLWVFLLAFAYWYQRMRFLQDQKAVRNRRATRAARKRLRRAAKLLGSGNKEAFFESVTQALWGYLADKLNLNLSQLTMDTISEALGERQVSEDDIQELKNIIESAEYARFAPPGSSSTESNMYDRALGVISKLENHLR